MDENAILDIVNSHYNIRFDRIEFIRESGSYAYALYSGKTKYFLRITKPMYSNTALQSLNIHLFLQENGFSVPEIIFTKEATAYITSTDAAGAHYYVVYEFIEGDEVDPESNAENIGDFIGKLHSIMQHYTGDLPKYGKEFYIDRYINILNKKNYPNANEFATYGDIIWDRLKDLPMAPCHGDMYRGNILQTAEGRMYLLDFDTFCIGFPMYDATLICNMTDYFNYSPDGLEKTLNIYSRFLPHYTKRNPVSQKELDCMCDLMALYHYSLQATIIELYGIDCVDNNFLDRQLDWLMKWEAQCAK
ncbi:MAG: phosphotransferase [Clostridia bacterium]|nr:phosphotransferase [Clostridia bacterium]